MKIFYVEDNKQNLLNFLQGPLFQSILRNNERKNLEELKEDGYSSSQDIVEIFQNSPYLSVEATFQGALKHLLSVDLNDYDLFIFDRDLDWVSSPYEYDDIKAIDKEFSRADFEYIRASDCFGREGDYLLSKICTSSSVPVSELKDKVFILSAFPSDDIFEQIAENSILRGFVNRGFFSKSNYIGKDDEKAIKNLGDIIASNDKKRAIYRKYSTGFRYFECLDDGADAKRLLIKILSEISFDSNKHEQIGEWIQKVHDIYQAEFGPDIQKRLDCVNTYLKDCPSEKKKSERTKWYHENPGIPQNIADLGSHLAGIRNRKHHWFRDSQDFNYSPFSLLSEVFALLEIARYFYEKDS